MHSAPASDVCRRSARAATNGTSVALRLVGRVPAPVTRRPGSHVRSVLCRPAFPSAPVLGSTRSAAAMAALSAGFPATMAGSRSARPCITGYGSSHPRCGPATAAPPRPGVRSPRSGAPFRRKQRLAHARVFDHSDPEGRSRMTRPPVLPSASRTASATGAISLSRLNSLACTIPCRRFADALASACARRGADVDRYSFIVMDSHLLLLASLLAHSALEKSGSRSQRPLRRELEGGRKPSL
jgi:hypothetical protein